MIEQRHPAFEQEALGVEFQYLVVDGEIAALERDVRAAEFGGFLEELERDSADMLLAEMTEFADRRHQRARRHAADEAIAFDQQRPCAVAGRRHGRGQPGGRPDEPTTELQSLMRTE